jgi:hypothetical protein
VFGRRNATQPLSVPAIASNPPTVQELLGSAVYTWITKQLASILHQYNYQFRIGITFCLYEQSLVLESLLN